MRKDRLTKLANFLEEKVKPQWFDLGIFCSRGFEKQKCGSVACAIGWMSAAFPRSGITIHRGLVSWKEYSNFEAAREFFEIDRELCFHLFNPMNYPSNRGARMDVVRRIRQTVKKAKVKGHEKSLDSLIAQGGPL